MRLVFLIIDPSENRVVSLVYGKSDKFFVEFGNLKRRQINSERVKKKAQEELAKDFRFRLEEALSDNLDDLQRQFPCFIGWDKAKFFFIS